MLDQEERELEVSLMVDLKVRRMSDSDNEELLIWGRIREKEKRERIIKEELQEKVAIGG